MKGFKRALITGAAIAGIVATQAPAQAATMDFLENWNMGLNNAGQNLTGTVQGIDYAQFAGLTHVQVTDNDRSKNVSPGDTFQITGLMSISSFQNSSNGGLDGLGLNANVANPGQAWEMTGKFVIDGVFGAPSTYGISFAHPASGNLDLYIDNLKNSDAADTSVKANFGTATGFTDGTHIASFTSPPNVPNTGGSINLATYNGSDDAFFQTAHVYQTGVFQNALAQDLGSTLAGVWTNSTLKSNANLATPSQSEWEAVFGAGTGNVDALNFFVHESGDANIVTPEPGTLVLLGAGLMGLAIFKKRRSAA